MTMRQIETLYGFDNVNTVCAMMGAGWETSDTPEDIAEETEISLEEAKLFHEIMQAIEEVM